MTRFGWTTGDRQLDFANARPKDCLLYYRELTEIISDGVMFDEAFVVKKRWNNNPVARVDPGTARTPNCQNDKERTPHLTQRPQPLWQWKEIQEMLSLETGNLKSGACDSYRTDQDAKE